MTDELQNQTHFAEDVVLRGDTDLAPPGTLAPPPQKKTRIIVLAAVGAVLLILLLSLLAALALRPRRVQAPRPTPSLSPQQQSELTQWQRRFQALDKQITTADPSDSKIAFPPIDFKLNLEDATTRQQQRR